ncbi:CAP domain-containing protein [Pseudoblastomonas halimionae]|uniref:SCP domain-containing protein n=1 Tax=Alteriqipengyuania halimionae TaxID=1926630 RepID=A0A6I4U269_9SPHN|nr:CAP domain-containing protein [Alteriqipengyuania halimionae]MXP09826.1 hypothetical protein [Alteriqipengyuania halimionae]
MIAGAIAITNEIRALHNLPPVAHSAADDRAVQESALMMVANNALSHDPPSSWSCWTQAGRDAAASGNLAFRSGSFGQNFMVFAGWMDEVDNLSIDSVGHRRWILDPFLTHTAFGRVVTSSGGGGYRSASVMRVFDLATSGATPSGLPDWYAYPQGDYPAKYYDTRAIHSFSVIADKSTKWGANRNVDFSAASVTVRDQASGGVLSLSKVSYDNQGFGLPNNLQFLPAGVQEGRTYEVTIANVRVNASPREYSYTFRIVS